MLSVNLNGFLPADYVAQGRVLIDLSGATGRPPFASGLPALQIHDARVLTGRLSDSEQFAQQGFVLLKHETGVQDWDNDIYRIYQPEIETIIRQQLLPGMRIEIQPGHLVRRGAGTKTPFYGTGIHNDNGLTAEDYQAQLEAFTTPEIRQRWRECYEQDEVVGFMVINFWRTTNMAEPLKHLPLALCDVRSVENTDIIPTSLLGFTPTGKPTNQLSLRYNPNQEWYYYPDMVTNEVLVFKNFYCDKSGSPFPLRSCFHTAFEDPTASMNVEKRQSCEFRVHVFFLKDG